MKAFEQKRRHAGQGGFTLIELLVVIAILGVLAGVVVFAVSGISNNSKDSACKIDLRTLKTAVQADIADNPGATATTEAGLVTAGLLEDESSYYSWTAAGGYTVEDADCPAP
jgi:prepilin-type N-terminal cleavage/methylation domain-containing protein